MSSQFERNEDKCWETFFGLMSGLKAYGDHDDPETEYPFPFIVRPRSMDDWLKSPISQMHDVSQALLSFEERLDGCFTDLMESPTFAAMIKQCPGVLNTPIVFDKLEDDWDAGAIYAAGLDYIIVNHEVSEEDYYLEEPSYQKFSSIIHEYRHAFHSLHNRINPNILSSSVHSMLSKSFIQEAEVNAFQATVCKELFNKGHFNYWRAYRRHSPQLAKALMDAIIKDPNALENGKAQTAVFYEWFRDLGKVNYYTDNAIKGLRENKIILNLPQHTPEENEASKKPNDAQETEEHCHEAISENQSKEITPFFVAANPRFNFSLNPHGLMPYMNDNEMIGRDDYMANLDLPTSTAYYTRHVSGNKIGELKIEIVKAILKQEEDVRAAATQPSPS